MKKSLIYITFFLSCFICNLYYEPLGANAQTDPIAQFWRHAVSDDDLALDRFLKTLPPPIILAAADASSYNAFHRLAERCGLCWASIKNQSSSLAVLAADYEELALTKNMFASLVTYCRTMLAYDFNVVLHAINSRNFLGETPLHLVATSGDDECALLLLELVDQDGVAIADVNAQVLSAEHGGHTPLILAAREGAGNIAALFLAHRNQDGLLDVDVNAATHNGLTALMWAAIRGHTAIVRMLLDYRNEAGLLGVEVNALSDQGETALTLAAECGHMDIVILLATARHDNGSLRANLGQRTRSGLDAVAIARNHHHQAIATYLEHLLS